MQKAAKRDNCQRGAYSLQMEHKTEKVRLRLHSQRAKRPFPFPRSLSLPRSVKNAANTKTTKPSLHCCSCCKGLCLISIVIFSTPISRNSVAALSASEDDYFICSVHSQRCCSNKRLAVNDSINCTMDSQLSHQNKCQLLQLRAECSIR
jgi:hypothetical protein